MKKYILFIDSGIGGLSTLSESIKRFNYNYIYFADDKNAPYGNLSKKLIIKNLTQIITNITQKYEIEYVVIACNTATAAAIDELRKIFMSITFIGTEPALNYAKNLGFKNIFSLTTPLTAKLIRYKRLKQELNCKISTYSDKNLVKIIENYYFYQTYYNKFNLLKVATNILKKSNNFECIVLGCTHYVFLKPFLKQISNKTLIDGNEGVINYLISKLNNSNITKNSKSTIKIILSSQNKSLKKKYKKILCQTLAN